MCSSYIDTIQQMCCCLLWQYRSGGLNTYHIKEILDEQAGSLLGLTFCQDGPEAVHNPASSAGHARSPSTTVHILTLSSTDPVIRSLLLGTQVAHQMASSWASSCLLLTVRRGKPIYGPMSNQMLRLGATS